MEISKLITPVTTLFEKLWKIPFLYHLTAIVLLVVTTGPELFKHTPFYDVLLRHQSSLNLALSMYSCFFVFKLVSYVPYIFLYPIRLMKLRKLSENECLLIKNFTAKQKSCLAFNSDLVELNSLLRKGVLEYPRVFVGGAIGVSTVEMSDWAKSLIYRHGSILPNLHSD
ncbi:hypothetical protein [Photobacterium damselae]|uniref:hypothetical protein n=1 Tax=Photobacterium damselae TaxID=38293 RepID=UPI000D056565|nr:hypothetical protein [Photobacterium damselae]PSB83897.1 hypothetical protein C5F62_07095 [Photobacterium damselae subsp. damselae]